MNSFYDNMFAVTSWDFRPSSITSLLIASGIAWLMLTHVGEQSASISNFVQIKLMWWTWQFLFGTQMGTYLPTA